MLVLLFSSLECTFCPMNPKATPTITVDDLIEAYLRFKDWMGYDVSHSAYCIKEVMAMQALFGTAYISFPPTLDVESYEELLTLMKDREDVACRWTEVVETTGSEDEMAQLERILELISPKSQVHYFTTMFQAILDTAATADLIDKPDGSQSLHLDQEPFDDHFEVPDEAYRAEIRKFMVGENFGIDELAFPVKALHKLGVPKIRPRGIDQPADSFS